MTDITLTPTWEDNSPKVVAFKEIMSILDGMDLIDALNVLTNAAACALMTSSMERGGAFELIGNFGPNIRRTLEVNWPEGGAN